VVSADLIREVRIAVSRVDGLGHGRHLTSMPLEGTNSSFSPRATIAPFFAGALLAQTTLRHAATIRSSLTAKRHGRRRIDRTVL
jgi:hypothetical protein